MTNTRLKGAVYLPPSDDMPPVAVIIGLDGEVLAARAAPSVAEGEAFLTEIMMDAARAEGLPYGWTKA